MHLLCPRDGQPLREAPPPPAALRCLVLACPACAGTFLRGGPFAVQLRGLARDRDVGRRPGLHVLPPVRCARCAGATTLRAADLAGDAAAVDVDVCDACGGLWLEGGELQRLALAFASTPRRAPRRRSLDPTLVRVGLETLAAMLAESAAAQRGGALA